MTSADLKNAELTRKSDTWQPYQIWLEDRKIEFFYRRRNVLGEEDFVWNDNSLRQFTISMQNRWKVLMRALDSPNLENADLRRARVASAFLPGADLTNAWLDRADFGNAQLAGAVFAGSMIDNASFLDASIDGASFIAGRLKRVKFIRATLNGAVFDGAELERVQFTESELVGASFVNSEVNDVSFRDTYMKAAVFENAIVTGGNFDNACLDMANLKRAIFEKTSFSGAVIAGTNIRGADLGNVQPGSLTQEQINSADGDDRTRLPQGLRRPRSWQDFSHQKRGDNERERTQLKDGVGPHYPQVAGKCSQWPDFRIRIRGRW